MNVVILVGVLEMVLLVGAIAFLSIKSGAKASANLSLYDNEITRRKQLLEDVSTSYRGLVSWKELREVGVTIGEIRELIKQERGRVTITQAELETVENRLRELDEVDREIQASGIETKEELRILNRKEKDLRSKNDNLKNQIATTLGRLEEVLSQVESNAQLLAQLEGLKTELMRTEQKCDELLIQIEQGNEQYFTLKQVYDALDIEYAQLYEKFADGG